MKIKLENPNFKENYLNNLLLARGVDNLEDFLHPTEEYLESPENLENIDRGVEALDIALEINKPMLLLVDCDCDGFTSSAIMYQYIKELKPEIEIEYILHEGKQHGLEDIIDTIENGKKEYSLIILPDSSSNDYEYHERLGKLGIPCLVLDHHLAEPPFSDNAIIINNQLSPNYKNKALTGAGVAYQFCRRYDATHNLSNADKYIDLAALGITGDMGSVLDMENRYIIETGFRKVNNYFFKTMAIKQAYSITKQMTSSWSEIQDHLTPMTVAFYIVPLINAMIRVGTQEEKSRLFLGMIDGHYMVPCNKRGAKGTLEEAAVESVRECVNARTHQNKDKEAAVARIESKIFKYDLLENQILFIRLDNEDNFPSVLNGLVATQLAEKYKHPTIVARLNDDGVIKGSIRGVSNSEFSNFRSYLNDTGLFDFVQGHEGAAGCAIPEKNLHRLHELANEQLSTYNFTESFFPVNFSRFATDEDLEALITDLSKYNSIWGTGNSTPLIYVHNITISRNDVQIMGKNKNAVRFSKNGIVYVKTYGAEDLIEKLQSYPELDIEVVGEANLNEWCGITTPQILIKEAEVHNAELSF